MDNGEAVNRGLTLFRIRLIQRHRTFLPYPHTVSGHINRTRVRRWEKAKARHGSIELPENRYTCRVINIGCAPRHRSYPGTLPFSLHPSFFLHPGISSPKCIILHAKFGDTAATRQSAYAYAAVATAETLLPKKTKQGKFVDNASCRRPSSFVVEKHSFSVFFVDRKLAFRSY